MTQLIDFILHADKHLSEFVQQYGMLTYAILFTVIFCETGLVVLPFLPGDALLFAAGATAAISRDALNPIVLFVLLAGAGILGNMVNYAIGRRFGDLVLARNLIKKEHLDKTHNFYERYGAMTLVIARFMPFVRTFAPFVAGASKMSYAKFHFYNILGGVLWVGLFIFLGYMFGNLPIVKNNFSLITLLIIAVTTLPVLITIFKQFLDSRQKP
jgi:membrane-associated protein